jgi:hypothetical protein
MQKCQIKIIYNVVNIIEFSLLEKIITNEIFKSNNPFICRT